MIGQALCIIAFIIVSAFVIAFCGLCAYLAVTYVWSVIVDFVKAAKRIYSELTA